MSEDNKKQNEPEEQKETSGDTGEKSADELEEVVGGITIKKPFKNRPGPPPPPHPWPS